MVLLMGFEPTLCLSLEQMRLPFAIAPQEQTGGELGSRTL